MATKGHLLYYPEGNHDINLDDYVLKNQLNDALKSKVDSITKITYADLKNLRDNSKLIPGSLYRITDYNCTTTQNNTRSAGHQFDIVLLALSENRLAEEGWAMEHPTDIYTTICTDGVEFKTAFYSYNDGGSEAVDIVDINSLKAEKVNMSLSELLFAYEMFGILDTNTKTIHIPKDSTEYIEGFTKENAIYNYFQNSNLSAWKVWYCLDNDKSRFAWADDSVDESSPASITFLGVKGEIHTFYRDSADDLNNLFAWKEGVGSPIYTTSQTPSVGDTVYYEDGTDTGKTVNFFTPAHEGTGPNGRGVIYRLIDEWNIDYPCDFKNMQTLIPMDSEDNIDMQNPVTSKYCYAFTDNTSGEPEDLSIKGHAINIKVKAKLIENTYSAMYFSPTTLFYTNSNESNNCKFSIITVGIAGITIFISKGHAITILDGSNNVMLESCSNIYIGYNSSDIMFNTVVRSTFGSNCQNIQLTGENDLNYGNNGVELATKDDLN